MQRDPTVVALAASALQVDVGRLKVFLAKQDAGQPPTCPRCTRRPGECTGPVDMTNIGAASRRWVCPASLRQAQPEAQHAA